MILIGSYAALQNGVKMRDTIRDIDIVGTPAELETFRSENAGYIESEKPVGTHRIHFSTRGLQDVEKIEFDFEQSKSDVMLDHLSAANQTRYLNSTFNYANLNTLYFTKRAHANIPVFYDKTIGDLLALKEYLSAPSAEELAYYKARKKECKDRFLANRQRFQLSVSNEDFFAISNHVRTYVHDDVHEAIAHDKGSPVYWRCKRDLAKAKIETDLFEQLSDEDQRRMVQEEFIVIGIERYYMRDRKLGCQEVYTQGMHKTIRDLFVGYFQDFCIDNLDRLQAAPDFDFLRRFEDGTANGEIRLLPNKGTPSGAKHRTAWAMFAEGNLDGARAIAVDLIRQADAPGDPAALHILGAVMLRQKNLPMAEKCLRQSVAIREINPQAWTHLGMLMMAKSDFESAAKCFKRSLVQNGQAPEVHVNLGITLERLNQPREARAAYEAALRVKPDAPVARQRLDALLAAHPAVLQ